MTSVKRWALCLTSQLPLSGLVHCHGVCTKWTGCSVEGYMCRAV